MLETGGSAIHLSWTEGTPDAAGVGGLRISIILVLLVTEESPTEVCDRLHSRRTIIRVRLRYSKFMTKKMICNKDIDLITPNF